MTNKGKTATAKALSDSAVLARRPVPGNRRVTRLLYDRLPTVKKTLQRLFQEHKGKVSDKWSLYLTEYDRLFSPLRERPVRLLEIGVQNGGSLELWSRYFSNAKKLVGCDINPDCAALDYDHPAIKVVIGDATTDAAEAAILAHCPRFELIIDDGSHRPADVVRAFARYFPHLSDEGLFVVEDLHCSYWQEYESGLYDPYSSIAFFKQLADIVGHEHWGVSTARHEFLDGFARKYDLSFNEEMLASIHSLELINSLCVIRKGDPGANRLGARIIAGADESVVKDLRNRLDEPSPDQSSNPWATPQQISTLQKVIEERDAEIALLKKRILGLERRRRSRARRA